MTFPDFLKIIKDAKIDTSPYLPFSAENIFVYPSQKRSKKPVGKPLFIAQHWNAGGVSGGSCWEGSSPKSYIGDSAPDEFPELVKILRLTCPNITFLQYKDLKEVIREGKEIEYACYGNHTDYGYQIVVLQELYDKLVEMGL